MNQDKTPATVSAAQGQETLIDPANTLTDKDGQTTSAQVGPVADEVAQADADDTYCPRCGSPCQLLPEGQPQPTQEERLHGCWLRADGTQPDHNWDAYCTLEARLGVALIDRAIGLGLDESGFTRDFITPERLCSPDLVAPFLRFAHRHPAVSDKLTLLLLDRLRGISVSVFRLPGGYAKRELDPYTSSLVCDLEFRLVGPGTVQTVRRRHHDELMELLKDWLTPLPFSRYWAAKYEPAFWVWECEHEIGRVLLTETVAGRSGWSFPWPPEAATSAKGGRG